MPITAKLSRQFYEKLGDEVANELVGWFNAVDDSYRREFRDLFESNFGRVEARVREAEARLDAKFERFEASVSRQLTEFRAELRLEMGRMETRLIRWMFAFWIGAWVTTIATVVAVQRLL